jgi:hypothetical protein
MDSSEERLAPYGSEPKCGCIQVDTDRDDATWCEFHNEHSEWTTGGARGTRNTGRRKWSRQFRVSS